MSESRKALVLRLDRDLMYADVACVEVGTPNSFTNESGLREKLTKEYILNGLNEKAISDTCAKIEEMAVGAKVRIAQGVEPTRGKDGEIDFAVDVSGKAVYNSGEDTENVDFRNATHIVSVNENELLATIIPPVPGEPGKTIRGEPIAPTPVKPAELRAGSNVRHEEAEGKFYSTVHGRPVYSDGVISVLPVYEINGDVDYNTGNIDFKGPVLVNGSIKDDFSVNAKALAVTGTIGACEITCKGDISVKGGITGKDKAKIICGGTVTAKFISNSTVECLGDVKVRREIVNSTIMTNGRVISHSLIGGHTMAKMGLVIRSLGSELGVTTKVEPGVDLEVRKIDNALAQIFEKIEAIVKYCEMFFGDRVKFKNAPEEKKEEIRTGYESFKLLLEAHDKLVEHKARLTGAGTVEPVKEVIVLKTMHADTIINTDLCIKNFNRAATGPIKLVEDIASSSIVSARCTQQELDDLATVD